LNSHSITPQGNFCHPAEQLDVPALDAGVQLPCHPIFSRQKLDTRTPAKTNAFLLGELISSHPVVVSSENIDIPQKNIVILRGAAVYSFWEMRHPSMATCPRIASFFIRSYGRFASVDITPMRNSQIY
jgi:hypothetical protein